MRVVTLHTLVSIDNYTGSPGLFYLGVGYGLGVYVATIVDALYIRRQI
jgi:hypothetical protein